MALLLVFFAIPLNLLVGIDVVHGAVLAVLTALSYLVAGQVGLGTGIIVADRVCTWSMDGCSNGKAYQSAPGESPPRAVDIDCRY